MSNPKETRESPPVNPNAAVKFRFDDSDDQNARFSSTPSKSNPLEETNLSNKDDEKKRSRKSIDDIKKRKEPSAFSNILHRFTWGRFGVSQEQEKKEEKHKNEDLESPKEVDRPDHLPLMEKLELGPDGKSQDFQSALDPGGSGYWQSNEDTLTPHNSQYKLQAVIREERNSELDEQERSLVDLLDEFRRGRMRALDDRQVLLMKEMKNAHEETLKRTPGNPTKSDPISKRTKSMSECQNNFTKCTLTPRLFCERCNFKLYRPFIS